jgi:hypothetical protein
VTTAPDNPKLAVLTAHRLGLPPSVLPRKPAERCHGYANGCACFACLRRKVNPTQRARPQPRQPWEPA